MQVYKRERESCNIGLTTHCLALFLIVLPHVLVSAVLTAVIFVPWVGLNSTGAQPPASALLQMLSCASLHFFIP